MESLSDKFNKILNSSSEEEKLILQINYIDTPLGKQAEGIININAVAKLVTDKNDQPILKSNELTSPAKITTSVEVMERVVNGQDIIVHKIIVLMSIRYWLDEIFKDYQNDDGFLRDSSELEANFINIDNSFVNVDEVAGVFYDSKNAYVSSNSIFAKTVGLNLYTNGNITKLSLYYDLGGLN